jgi:hypothetical protein
VIDPITTWRLAEIRQQELLEREHEMLNSAVEARQVVYQFGSALTALGERIKQLAGETENDDAPQTRVSQGAGD